jgi:hypothetical protein
VARADTRKKQELFVCEWAGGGGLLQCCHASVQLHRIGKFFRAWVPDIVVAEAVDGANAQQQRQGMYQNTFIVLMGWRLRKTRKKQELCVCEWAGGGGLHQCCHAAVQLHRIGKVFRAWVPDLVLGEAVDGADEKKQRRGDVSKYIYSEEWMALAENKKEAGAVCLRVGGCGWLTSMLPRCCSASSHWQGLSRLGPRFGCRRGCGWCRRTKTEKGHVSKYI